jgi:hypothetical protein
VIAAVCNLGGHDLDALAEAFGAIEDTRPTMIFAYTNDGMLEEHCCGVSHRRRRSSATRLVMVAIRTSQLGRRGLIESVVLDLALTSGRLLSIGRLRSPRGHA